MAAARLDPFDLLPDSLLGLILGLAGRAEGPSVTLVSKRWNQVFFSEPALWSLFELHSAGAAAGGVWFQGQRALLRRISGTVSSVKVLDAHILHTQGAAVSFHEGAFQLLGFLHQLSPAVLRELTVGGNYQLPGLALLDLLRFTRLETLSLSTNSLPEGAARTLRQLPLRDLRLRCLMPGAAGEQLVSGVAQLTGLTRLCLETPEWLPGFAQLPHAVLQLTALRGLHSLGLYVARSREGEVTPAPPPSAFPSLQVFEYLSTHGSFQVGDARMACISYPAFSPCSESLYSWEQALALEYIEHLPSLPALLSDVMPAGLPLTGLRLEGMPRPLHASQLQGCCAQLAGVTGLELRGWAQNNPAEAASLLSHLLGQCPGVVEFTAADCGLDGIPEPLASLLAARHITCLDLSDNCLQDLPPGDYLTGLHTLALSDNPLRTLPPALSGATSLRVLHLDSNWPQADVEGILLRMPCLEQLTLGPRG